MYKIKRFSQSQKKIEAREFGNKENKIKKNLEVIRNNPLDELPLNPKDERIVKAMKSHEDQVQSSKKKWLDYRKANESKEFGIWNGDSKSKASKNHFNQTKAKDWRLENKFKRMELDNMNKIPGRLANARQMANKFSPIDRLDSMKVEREFLKDQLNAKKLVKNVMKVVK